MMHLMDADQLEADWEAQWYVPRFVHIDVSSFVEVYGPARPMWSNKGCRRIVGRLDRYRILMVEGLLSVCNMISSIVVSGSN